MKFYYGDDIRVVEVSSSLTYDELRKGVDRKYNLKGLKISYKDSEGDLVTIDSQSGLAAAFTQYRKVKETTMKIFIQEVQTQQPFPVSNPIPIRRSSGTTSASGQSSEAETDEEDDEEPSPLTVPKPPVDYFAVPQAPALRASGRGQPRNTSGGEEEPMDLNTNEPLSPSSSRKRTRAGVTIQPAQTTSSVVQAMVAPDIPNAPGFSLAEELAEFKKHHKRNLLSDLEQSTRFGREELEQLHAWVKQYNKDGVVDKDAFTKGLQAIGITDPLLIEQNFNAFDADKDGKIDFREFACGLSVILKGTPEERLRLMFNSYDLNGDGYLTPDELLHLMKTSQTTGGEQSGLTDEDLRTMVYKVLAAFDTNKDGRLSWEEFQQAIKSKVLNLSCLVHVPQ